VTDSFFAERFDNGVVRRAGLASVRDGSAANGSAVGGWGAARNDHYDDSAQDRALWPMPALCWPADARTVRLLSFPCSPDFFP
jgi:hypothetical protein